MAIQEFLLKGAPGEVYRLALGELIPASDRTVYPPSTRDPAVDNQTGSIGFMDIQVAPYAGDKALMILCTGIEPGHRGNGYARKLLERAVEIAEEKGLTALVADDIASRGASNFWVHMGFNLQGAGTEGLKKLRNYQPPAAADDYCDMGWGSF